MFWCIWSFRRAVFYAGVAHFFVCTHGSDTQQRFCASHLPQAYSLAQSERTGAAQDSRWLRKSNIFLTFSPIKIDIDKNTFNVIFASVIFIMSFPSRASQNSCGIVFHRSINSNKVAIIDFIVAHFAFRVVFWVWSALFMSIDSSLFYAVIIAVGNIVNYIFVVVNNVWFRLLRLFITAVLGMCWR